MSLLSDGDVLVQYRYQILLFILFSDNTIMNVDPSKIISIDIDNSYESAKLPIFKLSILVEASDFFRIIKDKNDIKFQLRIQKYGINLKNKKKTLVKDVINETYGLYIDENPEDLEAELRKRQNDNKNKNEKTTNIMELYLFKKEIVDGIIQPSNMIIRNVTLSSLVSYLLYKAGCRKVLMSPFDNINEYDRIILPPQSIYENIKWLDSYYGFYKTGSMLYFDIDKTYLLKYGPECTAWCNNELTNTTILISQNSKESENGSGMIQRLNNNQYYINGNSSTIQIINNILGLNLTVGSNATLINSSTNTLTNIKNDYDLSNKGAHSYINDRSSNKYIDTIYEQQLKSQEIVINMAITEYDFSSLTPNKQINIIFEDQSLANKYNGVYKVCAVIHKFLRDKKDFTLASSVSFKKMK